MKFKDLNAGSAKNYLRLKAGESVRGVFRGDIEDFRQHWVNNRSSICTGRDKCELCKAGEKSSFRFRVNFITQENGAYVAKTFEQGRAVYEALKALNADYPLESNLMKITRHGSGTDTTYGIVPAPNGQLTKDQDKAVSAVKHNEMSTSQAEEVEEDVTEDAPF